MLGPTIIALDFETANHAAHSACQLALVRIEDWFIVSKQSWMIRPPDDLFSFTHIHGIAWEDVAGEPHFGDLWAQMAPYFEGADYIAAHNAPFDRSVLNACCELYSKAAPGHRYLDTVHIARKVFNIFPTKLNMVCERLGIELNHHEAMSDANACAEILIRANAFGWKP
jgi:DNA polymerase-3 subunit epsilon